MIGPFLPIKNNTLNGGSNGLFSALGISVTSLIKQAPGRLATVIVTAAGTGVGRIYDVGGNTAANSAALIAIIPNTVGPVLIDFPVSNGIYVVPGTTQIIALSYT